MKFAVFMGVLAVMAYPEPGMAQERKDVMTHQARGTFTVTVVPLTPAPAEGLSRFSINKILHGDLEATTVGEMFSGGDPKLGFAGYVAIEVVTGTLGGKHGANGGHAAICQARPLADLRRYDSMGASPFICGSRVNTGWPKSTPTHGLPNSPRIL